MNQKLEIKLKSEKTKSCYHQVHERTSVTRRKKSFFSTTHTELNVPRIPCSFCPQGKQQDGLGSFLEGPSSAVSKLGGSEPCKYLEFGVEAAYKENTNARSKEYPGLKCSTNIVTAELHLWLHLVIICTSPAQI